MQLSREPLFYVPRKPYIDTYFKSKILNEVRALHPFDFSDNNSQDYVNLRVNNPIVHNTQVTSNSVFNHGISRSPSPANQNLINNIKNILK